MRNEPGGDEAAQADEARAEAVPAETADAARAEAADAADATPAEAHVERAREGDRAIARALALVRFLRERCPWDARQDPRTLRPYLLEEAHETADAIQAGDDEALAGELGDLLLNIAFQIVLGEERGAFDAGRVMEALEAKMVARHPHVYGDAEAPPDWEALKAAERGAGGTHPPGGRAAGPRGGAADPTGEEPADPTAEEPAARSEDPFHGLSAGLDPLSRAARAQERMAAVGFDWPDLAGPLAKVREEVAELEAVARDLGPRRIGEAGPEVEEEIGDLLFAAVNVARLSGAHPANALLVAIEKFEERCRAMIELAESREIDWRRAGLERLDHLWDEVKRRG